MFSHIFESAEGISGFGIDALLIFFSIFVIVIIRTIRMDKDHVKKMGNLPLESNQANGNNGEH